MGTYVYIVIDKRSTLVTEIYFLFKRIFYSENDPFTTDVRDLARATGALEMMMKAKTFDY